MPDRDSIVWPGPAEAQPKDLTAVFRSCQQYLLLLASRGLGADLRGKVSASDVVQETFLEAQRDMDQFQGASDARLRAWLRRILLNNVAAVQRRFLASQKRDPEREVSLAGDSRCGSAFATVCDTPTPSERAIQREEQERLERCLDRLPRQYREVILLRHRDGKSFDEVAYLTGRSVPAARKLWSRALERLQVEMGP
jgi:RNA polymerase sigma-70 factor, ECF subfamily